MSVFTADEVAVDLLARYDKLERQLAKADSVVDRRLGGMEGRASQFAGRFSAALGAVSVAALAKEFLKLSDTAKQIDAQLRLATSGFGSFAQAQVDVQRLTAATRGELSSTASLYGNFVRASQESGRSQEEAARATETFAKALKIGGADANAAASATLQFSQALASGVLRGDEFNSIMEASPRIARLLADALGVPIGQLRKMAEAGQITRDVLFKALTGTKFTAGIDEEFKTLPVTFADAMQQVENSAVLTFGAFDRGGQFSTALATFVSDGSDGFKGLATDAEQLGVDIRATLAGLYDAFNPLLEGARSVFAILGADSRSIVEQVRADISFILGAIDRFSNLGNGVENSIRGALGLGAGAPASNLQGRFNNGFNTSQQAGQQAAFRRAFGAEGAFNLNKPGGARVLTAQAPRVSPSSAASDKPKGKGRGTSAATAERAAEAQRMRELRNDESFENEKAGLQQDLLRARRSMAISADAVAQYELQEIEAARVRQNDSYQRDVAGKKLTQVRAAELVALNDQLAAQKRQAVEVEQQERARAARTAITQGDLTNARDIASAEADLALTARDRRAAALRVLDLEYQIERSRLDALVASEQSTDAEKEVARRRLAVLPTLQENDRSRVEQQKAGPLGDYRNRLRSEAGDVNAALEQVAVSGLGSLEDGLAGVLAGTGSLSDGFKRMATSIIADLARVSVQRGLLSLLGNFLPGGGGRASPFGDTGYQFKSPGFGDFSADYSGLPKLAGGGTIRAGGIGGVDRNVLSVNGTPRAMIGAHETLSVANPNLRISPDMVAARGRPTQIVVQQTVQVDARNSVNPAGFEQRILQQANGFAVQVGRETAKQTLKAVPASLARYDTLSS
jgi:tape measure domain-containing protein